MLILLLIKIYILINKIEFYFNSLFLRAFLFTHVNQFRPLLGLEAKPTKNYLLA